MMAKKDGVKPHEGEHYDVLENGCIKITRKYPCLTEEYLKEEIPNFLELVDHKLTLEKPEYEKLLEAEESALNALVRQLEAAQRSLIIVFQGRDGAGKSGATERILQAVDYDMEIFDAIHVGPPTDEELAHPFLWRFTKCERIPGFGHVRVFDRSWYERVLVEPVMGLTKPSAIRLSYAQLRTFEWVMASGGAIIVKFWLDISKEEQEERFKRRAKKKPWKLSEYDAAARKRWDDYTVAANEMLHRTATEFAPWHLVSSDDKSYSRVTVLQIINQALRDNLKKNKG